MKRIKSITLLGLGAGFFGILEVIFLASSSEANFPKIWFVCMSPVQFFISLPAQRYAKELHDGLRRKGISMPKDRDRIIHVVRENATLVSDELLSSYNFWQSLFMFLGGALLCSIAVLTLQSFKFV